MYVVLSYLCLNSQCYGSRRLLCNRCIKQNRHKNHQIILINKAIDPFSRLCMNSYQRNSRQIYKQLNASIQSIVKAMDKVVEQFCQEFQLLKNSLVNTMQTICGSYSPEFAQDACNNCQRRIKYQKKEDYEANLNIIAQKISFLLTLPNSNQNHTDKFNLVSKKAVDIVTQNSLGMVKMINNMKAQFSKLKINLTKQDQNDTGKDEKAPLKTNKISYIKDHNSKIFHKKSFPLKIEHTPPANFLKFKQSISEQFLSSQQIKGQNHELRNEEQMQEEAKNAESQDSIKTKNENEEKERPTLVISQQLEIRGLEYSKYQVLVIQDTGKKTAQIMEILPLFKHLQSISIFDMEVSQLPHIVTLLNNIPLTVKQIYFNSSNQFNLQCINTLNSRGLNHITHLEYFYNVHNLMQRIDQSLYYKERNTGIRIEPLTFQSSFQIIQQFPNIVNWWVSSKDFTISGKRKVSFEQFQHLIIGQLEDQPSSTQRMPNQLINGLSKTVNLKTLCLLNVHMSVLTFNKVIKSNVGLESIYLQCCQSISEKSMELIQPQSNLVNFSIKSCPLISGKFIEKLDKTKIFIMDYAEYSSQDGVVFESFERLKNLVYLNLYGNMYLGDQLLYDLSGCQTLKSLNIGNTSITHDCINAFSKLNNLQCLCLDQNKLSAQHLLSILSFTPEITKLSICGYNGENGKGVLTTNDLNAIGMCLPKLANLSIRNCPNLDAELNSDAFQNLKYVQIETGADRDLIESFKNCGAQVFEDK